MQKHLLRGIIAVGLKKPYAVLATLCGAFIIIIVMSTRGADERLREAVGPEIGGRYWWAVVYVPNPVDSTWVVRAALPSVVGTAGAGGLPVMLWARCRANVRETTLWVHYHVGIGSDGPGSATGRHYKDVTIQLGVGDAYADRWEVSTYAHQSVYAPSPVALLIELAHVPYLVLEMRMHGRGAVRAVWNTAGVAQYLQVLAEMCGWDFP